MMMNWVSIDISSLIIIIIVTVSVVPNIGVAIIQFIVIIIMYHCHHHHHVSLSSSSSLLILLLVHMTMSIMIDAMSHVLLPDQSAGHWFCTCWALHANLFVTKFVHTCYSYTSYRHHWLLPSYITITDLDLHWGHKVSAKQNLWASCSCTLFNWSGWNLIWCWISSSWMSLYCFCVRFSETRKIAAVLLTA